MNEFDSEFYLSIYPDVADAIRRKEFDTAEYHYERWGKNEGRIPVPYSTQEEFAALSKLLKSDKWPEAVAPYRICNSNSESEKEDRGKEILESLVMVDEVKQKKFLDLGCGEGHLVHQASSHTSCSVGYDVVQVGELTWGKDDGYLLTTSVDEVLTKAPYDVVCLHDVLDHCKEPESLFAILCKAIHTNTVVLVRCHPWCSPHGAHQYKIAGANKAYIHLVFSNQELDMLDIHLEDCPQQLTSPVEQYETWFQRHGLEVVNREIDEGYLSNFFRQYPIKQRLCKLFGTNALPQCLAYEFVDYRLKKSAKIFKM